MKLKKHYADVVVGFNNSSSPLGDRDDLHILYEAAKQHNDTSILEMFEQEEENQIASQVEPSDDGKSQQPTSTTGNRPNRKATGSAGDAKG